VYGRRCRQCCDDRGRANWQHNARHQLFGVTVEEGLAKRGKLDDQGINVTTQALILGDF